MFNGLTISLKYSNFEFMQTDEHVCGNLLEIIHLEDVRDKSMILKWIWKTLDLILWTGWSVSGLCAMEDFVIAVLKLLPGCPPMNDMPRIYKSKIWQLCLGWLFMDAVSKANVTEYRMWLALQLETARFPCLQLEFIILSFRFLTPSLCHCARVVYVEYV